MNRIEFANAPRVWVERAEEEKLLARGTWFPLDCYGPELKSLPHEVGMVVVRGKITQRIFAYE